MGKGVSELRYNTSFEISSLLFLFFMAIHYFRVKRFPDRKNLMFGLILAFSILTIGTNLLCHYTIDTASRTINILLFQAVFSLQLILAVLLFFYALTICGLFNRKHAWLTVITTVLFLASLVMITTNIVNGWLFFFDKDMNFYRGFMYELYFIPFEIILIGSFAVPFIALHDGNTTDNLVIPAYSIIVAICITIQYFVPSLILSGLGVMIGNTLIYLNIQNSGKGTDPLTSVYSREAFTKYIDELIMEKKSYPLIYADIVGTSTINKTFGETNGNMMISQVAAMLCGLSGKNLIFRYTGDSFIILVRDTQHLNQFKDRLLGKLRSRFETGTMSIQLQMRMFCIMDTTKETSSESLTRTIEMAEKALRNAQPNTIPVINQEMADESQRTTEIKKALQRAIDNNSIEIFLQPVIDNKTGKVAAAEALARISDPLLGLIRPMDFIPIAEETGMISSMTLQVVNRVCMFLKSAPLDCYRDFKWVSINLSISDCLSRAQGEKICNIISSYGINPSKISFEITETMATIEKVLPENLKVLTEKGYTLALDDFGTEYANLDSALRLPFSLVKLDKSVIHIVHNGNRMKILKKMVEVFSDLGLETVAEGVDSQEIVNIATSAGARYLQGFFYSKPLPVNVFINYLISNKEQSKQ